MEIRRAGPGDIAVIQWALLGACSWSPASIAPPLDDERIRRYHEGWGRPGDLGVIAEDGGELVGAAYCRLMRGYGYVDDATPELTIAVREQRRGEGVGTRLLAALADLARTADFARLSLSVRPDNPARRLYDRSGYRAIGCDDGGSVTMLLELR